MTYGTQVNIRPIRPEDAVPVSELVTQLGYERTADQVRNWVHGLDSRPEQAAFVAELDDKVVAWIDVSFVWHLQSDAFGLIGGLTVKDGVRGAGIGRLLCERAEDWSREKGAGKIRVTSRNSREAAHRFYLRDGYQQTKISMVFEKLLEP